MGSTPYGVGAAVLMVLLAGCGAPDQPPLDGPPGPVREHWALSHRVPESSTMRVVGQRMDHFSETTEVLLRSDRDGQSARCSVTVDAPGQGGPENMVGEQLPATVQGGPALRNGPGAEGDYLIWQRADGRWASSQCSEDGQQVFQDRLAEAVETKPSSIDLPLALRPLPAGYDLSSISQDRSTGLTRIDLGPAGPDPDGSERDLVVTFDDDPVDEEGRPITVGGRPATLDETPRDPDVCLVVQGHHVCVGTSQSDTGPYPDRSGEIPTLLAVAEALRFPDDLGERSTWFPAEEVFG